MKRMKEKTFSIILKGNSFGEIKKIAETSFKSLFHMNRFLLLDGVAMY